jgi:hypothetical protein
LLLGLALGLLVQSPTVGVESAVDEFGCSGRVEAYSGLGFINSTHERWYRRFWAGRCDGLPLFVCLSGRPYWADSMQRVLLKVAPETRAVTLIELCTLGRRVGYEWAKENNVRTIDTKTVADWTKRLEQAADPQTVLRSLEIEVDQRLQAVSK